MANGGHRHGMDDITGFFSFKLDKHQLTVTRIACLCE